MPKGFINAKPKVVDTEDPSAIYGKSHNQHNVPKRVKNFNRVTPKEAFGNTKKANPNPKSKSKSKKL